MVGGSRMMAVALFYILYISVPLYPSYGSCQYNGLWRLTTMVMRRQRVRVNTSTRRQRVRVNTSTRRQRVRVNTSMRRLTKASSTV
jgi:hypothetical protein